MSTKIDLEASHLWWAVASVVWSSAYPAGTCPLQCGLGQLGLGWGTEKGGTAVVPEPDHPIHTLTGKHLASGIDLQIANIQVVFVSGNLETITWASKGA